MKRAHITTVWPLACATVCIVLLQSDGVAAPADDIIFAPKAFFDFDNGAVEISGTLTGEDVPYKNNTVAVACWKDRRECLTYSIEQIGRNQVSHLHGPVIYPITTWNAYEVIATEDASALDCRKTTITLQRKRQSAVWVEEPDAPHAKISRLKFTNGRSRTRPGIGDNGEAATAAFAKSCRGGK
jgi:hypothetical protein